MKADYERERDEMIRGLAFELDRFRTDGSDAYSLAEKLVETMERAAERAKNDEP